MSVEGLASSGGPAEAASAATRVQRLQELLRTAAEADTTVGESSFAAALQAASTEGDAPPEAPEPAEPADGEAETTLQTSTAGSSGVTSTSVSAYASPYVSAESSAVGALEAAAGTAEGPAGYESPETEALGSAYGATSSATPTYLDTSSAAYAPSEDSVTGAVDTSSEASTAGAVDASGAASTTGGVDASGEQAGGYASSLDGDVYASSAESRPATGASLPEAGGAGTYASLIDQEASRNGVEPALLQGLIEQESGFDPNAESSAGAQGLTQLMPSTAASLGVSDPFDPKQAIAGGAKLLGELLRQFDGNVSDALAGYNAGAGAVQQYGGVPPYPETEAYVTKVLANAQGYRGAA